jgi:uncharacterized damage-inducible protein DinB
MRSDDLTLLFGHLYWMRDRILQAADGLEPVAFRSTPVVAGRDLRETLVHELDVEWSWRVRLQRDPAVASEPEGELEPADYPTLPSLAEHWRRDELEMREWLVTLTDADLAAPPAAERRAGPALSVYLGHVVIHGIEQLTFAAAILSALGRSPGDLDLLDSVANAGAGAGSDAS